jgi:hypothetical protein
MYMVVSYFQSSDKMIMAANAPEMEDSREVEHPWYREKELPGYSY